MVRKSKLSIFSLNGGSGGGGSSGVRVGTVTNGSSFPTERPDSSPLQNGDYVGVDPSSTFPFTISSVTFTTATDKGVYFGGVWSVESAGYATWNTTTGKPFESLSKDFNVVSDKLEVNDSVYAKIDYVDTLGNTKVDKVAGKGLSTNDLTNSLLTTLQNKYTKDEVDSLLASSRSIKVVATLPSPTVPNTMYYVGTASPYNVYLYDSNNVQIDLGTSDINLTDYQKKQDNTLSTTSKEVVGAINELKDAIDDKSTVTVSDTGTATDTVSYITIDGVEKKLAGGGSGTDDYELLNNKPSINGEELIGDKSSYELSIFDVQSGTALPTAEGEGQMFYLTTTSGSFNPGFYRFDGTVWVGLSSGGGGTDDYNFLNNKPQINGNTLSYNLSTFQLGIYDIPHSEALPSSSTSAYHFLTREVGANKKGLYMRNGSDWDYVGPLSGEVEYVDTLPSLYDVKMNVLYVLTSNNTLNYYDGSSWQTIGGSSEAEVYYVDSLPTSSIEDEKLYVLKSDGTLHYHTGTGWHDISKDVFCVASLPLTAIKDDSIYIDLNDNSLHFHNTLSGVSKWHSIWDIKSGNAFPDCEVEGSLFYLTTDIILSLVTYRHGLYRYDGSTWDVIGNFDSDLIYVNTLPTSDIIDEKIYINKNSQKVSYHNVSGWHDFTGATTEEITTDVQCGGLSAGSVITKGTTFNDFVKMITQTAKTPNLLTVCTPAQRVYEKGSSLANITIDVTYSKVLEPLVSIDIYRNGVNIYNEDLSGKDSGTINETITGPITDTQNISVMLFDQGGVPAMTVNTYSFYMKSYCGLVEATVDDTNITQAIITALSSDLKDTIDISNTSDYINQKLVYAFPTELGDVSTIEDGNGFNVIDSFTRSTIDITNSYGVTGEYTFYILTNPTTNTGLTYIFKG